MTDDLSEAYEKNEAMITRLCEDESTIRSNERFELGMWKVVSCLGAIAVFCGVMIFWQALWATPLFLYPLIEAIRLKAHCRSRCWAIQIQLERCFSMRAYLKSRMRGF